MDADADANAEAERGSGDPVVVRNREGSLNPPTLRASEGPEASRSRCFKIIRY